MRDGSTVLGEVMRFGLSGHCLVGGLGCTLGLGRGSTKPLGLRHGFPEIAQATVAQRLVGRLGPEASARGRLAASASTLRIDSSSANRSRVISVSSSAGRTRATD